MIIKMFVKLTSFCLFFVFIVSQKGTQHYSCLEREALIKFRGMLKFSLPNEYMKHDDFLINWIRAVEKINTQNNQNQASNSCLFSHGHDLNKALTNLENTLKWREENKMDEILNEDFGDFYQKYPFELTRSDKEGSLVAVFQYGKWNAKKALETENKQKFYKYIYYMLEKAATTARSSNFNGPQYSWIVDVGGFDLEKHTCSECVALYPYVYKALDIHYPNLVKNFFQVNVPKIFNDVNNNLIKSNLSPKLNERVGTFGDKKEWLHVVKNVIDGDQLPKDIIDGQSSITSTTTIKPSSQSIGQLFPWLNKYAVCKVQSGR